MNLDLLHRRERHDHPRDDGVHRPGQQRPHAGVHRLHDDVVPLAHADDERIDRDRTNGLAVGVRDDELMPVEANPVRRGAAGVDDAQLHALAARDGQRAGTSENSRTGTWSGRSSGSGTTASTAAPSVC